MQKISIIIPAHNEQNRIARTLHAYIAYFDNLKHQGQLDYELVVVNNGSADGTAQVVQNIAHATLTVRLLDFVQGGKGFAITQGFKDALQRPNDYIGFVDADMATQPEFFHALLPQHVDGIIASRYMKGSQVTPARPWIKYWGRRLVYDTLVRLLFGLNFHDYQCGAKIFKRAVIQDVVDELTVTQWAFDVELLYLCKKHGYTIIEVPTVWHDQAGSQLRIMRGGMKMLSALFKVRMTH
ncbi:MAG TPA: glycosyltransferase [Candidatus Limnocylindria bacterium]|nr:glycosyltransferase [Candidatus Limnocylindria bacterium]